MSSTHSFCLLFFFYRGFAAIGTAAANMPCLEELDLGGLCPQKSSKVLKSPQKSASYIVNTLSSILLVNIFRVLTFENVC